LLFVVSLSFGSTLTKKMARILIGSSNIRRFYPCDQTNEYLKYKVEAATLKRAFEVTLEAIPSDAKVVISVLENFIEKEVNIETEGEKEKTMKRVIQQVVAAVVTSARKNKEARFAMAYPILRPNNLWMTTNEDSIRKEFEAAINSQCEINISKIDAVSRASQEFEKDGVHLTQSAGRNFVGNLIGMAEESFSAIQIDMEGEDGDKEDDQISKVLKLGAATSAAKSSLNINDLKKTTNELKTWKNHIERNLNSRFRSDNLMFARLRDEMDSETNRKREDRTQVTGLVEQAKVPRVSTERNEFLRNAAKEFCSSIKNDFDGTVVFATTSGKPEKGNLILEFRLDSVEKAREIRKTFATKRAENSLPASMENVQVMPVVTLATKIRIDIMKAVARRIESGTETAYVPNFLPRPILHVKAKGPGGEPRRHISSLTFADTIMEYGGLLKGGDLASAYKRAGLNFRGQMRQHFVVLEDPEISSGRFSVPPPRTTSTTTTSTTTSAPSATSVLDPVAGGSGGSGTRGTKRSGADLESGSSGVKRSQPNK
jgi:hypothetical protein